MCKVSFGDGERVEMEMVRPHEKKKDVLREGCETRYCWVGGAEENRNEGLKMQSRKTMCTIGIFGVQMRLNG